jgi:outer membrane protein assembly factor BamB
VNSSLASPTGANSAVFALLGGQIAVLNLTNGNLQWNCTEGCCAQETDGVGLAVGSTLPCTLQVGDPCLTKTPLSVDTKKCLWSAPLVTWGVVVGGREIIATQSGGTLVVVESVVSGVYGINALTGAILWHRSDLPLCEESAQSQICSPNMSPNDVIYFSAGSLVIGLEASTGHMATNFSVPDAVIGGPSSGQSLILL